jgi:hypothetical protein
LYHPNKCGTPVRRADFEKTKLVKRSETERKKKKEKLELN